MSRREDSGIRSEIELATIAGIKEKNIKGLNLQVWTDVRKFASLIAFAESQDIVGMSRYSEVINWALDTLIASARANFAFEQFELPSDAVTFLRERGFSLAQMSPGDRRARRAILPMQMESMAREKEAMRRREDEQFFKRVHETKKLDVSKMIEEFKRANPGMVVSESVKPEPEPELEPDQVQKMTREEIFNTPEDSEMLFNDQTDPGVSSEEQEKLRTGV